MNIYDFFLPVGEGFDCFTDFHAGIEANFVLTVMLLKLLTLAATWPEIVIRQ